jgi:hypothetical protein
LENELAYHHNDNMSNHEPYVASFTFSPARGIHTTDKDQNSIRNEAKGIKKKRYEYFFDNAY